MDTSLQSQLDGSKAAITLLQSQLATCQATDHTLDQELLAADEHIAKLQDHLERAREANDKLHAELALCHDEGRDLRQEVRSLHDQLEDLHSQLGQCSAKLAAAKAEALKASVTADENQVRDQLRSQFNDHAFDLAGRDPSGEVGSAHRRGPQAAAGAAPADPSRAQIGSAAAPHPIHQFIRTVRTRFADARRAVRNQ